MKPASRSAVADSAAVAYRAPAQHRRQVEDRRPAPLGSVPATMRIERDDLIVELAAQPFANGAVDKATAADSDDDAMLQCRVRANGIHALGILPVPAQELQAFVAAIDRIALGQAGIGRLNGSGEPASTLTVESHAGDSPARLTLRISDASGLCRVALDQLELAPVEIRALQAWMQAF